MISPKFNNGDIVILDPVGDGRGLTGKIISVMHNIDGSFDYLVSHATFGATSITRIMVAETEIQLKEKE